MDDAAPALKPSNIVSWSKLADRLDIKELKSKCVEIMSSSLAEVSRFKEFQELSFNEVCSFVSSAQETDVDPDDLLDASMEWDQLQAQSAHRPHGRTSRENTAPGMLSRVFGK